LEKNEFKIHKKISRVEHRALTFSSMTLEMSVMTSAKTRDIRHLRRS